jgi:hypothetical protein
MVASSGVPGSGLSVLRKKGDPLGGNPALNGRNPHAMRSIHTDSEDTSWKRYRTSSNERDSDDHGQGRDLRTAAPGVVLRHQPQSIRAFSFSFASAFLLFRSRPRIRKKTYTIRRGCRKGGKRRTELAASLPRCLLLSCRRSGALANGHETDNERTNERRDQAVSSFSSA